MLKRVLSVVFVCAFMLYLTGCGSPPTESQSGTKSQAVEKGSREAGQDTVTFAYISMVQTSPQALINKKYDVFGERLKKLGKKVNFVATRSLDNIWPMMDRDKGDPDFVYIPAANFCTYITETSRFGGSNKYAIIAGSCNSNSTVLIVRAGINSLKDLDGKKVGVANLRYSDEFQFNKVLSTVGLSTSSVGGTVQTVWDDIVPKELENFKNGKYDGILLYSPENFPVALKSLPGSKILTTLNPNGLFGQKQPRIWLVAKKDIIKNNPELVKEVLRGHLLLTEKAVQKADELPALNREVFLDYFKQQNAEMANILKENPLEFYQKKWSEAEITYDPNLKFVNEVFGFMDRRGLVKGKAVGDFVQMDLFNQVLRESGKPLIQ